MAYVMKVDGMKVKSCCSLNATERKIAKKRGAKVYRYREVGMPKAAVCSKSYVSPKTEMHREVNSENNHGYMMLRTRGL